MTDYLRRRSLFLTDSDHIASTDTGETYHLFMPRSDEALNSIVLDDCCPAFFFLSWKKIDGKSVVRMVEEALIDLLYTKTSIWKLMWIQVHPNQGNVSIFAQ